MKNIVRKILVNVCLVMVLVSGSGTSQAAEYVRVALVQQASQIHISSSGPLNVRFVSGKVSLFRTPITLSPATGGFWLNGELSHSDRFIVQSRSGDLDLGISQIASGGDGRTQGWSLSGDLEVRNQEGTLLVVNRVDLEEYVAGVVSSEINPSWHPEALKSQAVAARTYVLHKKMLNLGQPFEVVANVQDQVYGGKALVSESIRKAVEATRGMVIAYERRPIFAAYSSTAAGPTEDAVNVWAADLPYLKGVDCPFDENSPRFQWQTTLELTEMEKRLRQEGYSLGSVATLTPFRFTRAGRVNEIRILHSKGELILRGQDFRRVIGYTTIPSTQFSIDRFGAEIIFSGKGAGHAVGMCQWGAKEMAELGYRYESILQYYYPGTQLLHRRAVDLTPPG